MRGTDVGSKYTVMSYGGVKLSAGTGGSSIVRADAERDGKEEHFARGNRRLIWRCLHPPPGTRIGTGSEDIRALYPNSAFRHISDQDHVL